MRIPSITMLYEKTKKVNEIRGSSLLSPAHGRVGARATSLSFPLSVPPPSEKIAGGFQQAGKKKKGCGENEFLPACLPAEGGLWGGGVSAIPASAERQNRKIFVSLIEKNFGGARIKKCSENFSVLLAIRRAETLGGIQSAKSSGFCSKKVLTSSSRHHHIELAASLGASPLASAVRFARKSKGFLPRPLSTSHNPSSLPYFKNITKLDKFSQSIEGGVGLVGFNYPVSGEFKPMIAFSLKIT